MSDMTVQTFVNWFQENNQRLGHEDPEQAAEEIATAIDAIDERLGIELAAENDGSRELIFTAFSEESLFGLVKEIVSKAGEFPGWSLVALKPPRGFQFNLSIGNSSLCANQLEFHVESAEHARLTIVVSRQMLTALNENDQAQELAWLIIETGIGEELTSKFDDIRFGVSNGHPQPIDSLIDTVIALP